MKKLLIFILVILLAFSGVVGYLTMQNRPAETAEAQPPAAEEGEEEYGITFRTIDREAVYALHEPDEIVATIDGRDVTWDEYFFWLAGMSVSVENQMMQMAFYGADLSWEDAWGDDPDENFFDYVFNGTEERLRTFAVVESIAAEYGVELSEEEQATLAEELAQYRIDSVGEERTDEEYASYLREMEYMDQEILETLMRDSLLYQACFTAIYGEDGALVSEEDALAYLEDNGYMNANHILRRTVDLDTGEALDEDAAAQKEAEAAAIAAQLQAVEEPEELLELLAKLKATWDEDPGAADSPDGYVFGEGEMVEAFENAVKGLKEYQVSDPVKSDYGYHVIVRLPLDPDAVLGYSTEGTPITARAACANVRYGELLDERLEQAKLSYAEGFQKPDLSQYVIEESF